MYRYVNNMNDSARAAVSSATICLAPPHSAIPDFQSVSVKPKKTFAPQISGN